VLCVASRGKNLLYRSFITHKNQHQIPAEPGTTQVVWHQIT